MIDATSALPGAAGRRYRRPKSDRLLASVQGRRGDKSHGIYSPVEDQVKPLLADSIAAPACRFDFTVASAS